MAGLRRTQDRMASTPSACSIRSTSPPVVMGLWPPDIDQHIQCRRMDQPDEHINDVVHIRVVAASAAAVEKGDRLPLQHSAGK